MRKLGKLSMVVGLCALAALAIGVVSPARASAMLSEMSAKCHTRKTRQNLAKGTK